MVIGNGSSAFLCTPSWRVYDLLCTLSISHYYMPCLFPSFDVKLEILLDCWGVWYLRYANHPFYVSAIHFLKFYCLKNSTSMYVNTLVGSFTLLYIISKLYLYPNGYGVVVLVGLMFCYYLLHTWVCNL